MYTFQSLRKHLQTMTLSFRIHTNLDLVYDYLTDMQKFVTVHPVIYKMNKTTPDTYLVHETLKAGFISFSFTYPATIEKNEDDKSVIIRAIVFKLTKINMKFTLTADNEHTIINEQILFKTILPVKGIMKNIFKTQHQKLFENIELMGK